jgi:riboflavin kinase/FMN adenylyltransferase
MIIDTDYRALARAGQDGLPLSLSGAVVAIGNFDGVHRGHAALLAHARDVANGLGAPLVALTFDPHPRRHFMPDAPPFMLSDNVMRAENLRTAGADAVVTLRFDAILAHVTAGEFIDTILTRAFAARHVIVGENFLFGYKRGGGVDTLRAANRFGVTGFALVVEDGVRLSSNVARDAVRLGRMAAAEQVLGRPWALRGTVLRGAARGRTIGFPTANIGLGAFIRPAFGVYAGHVAVEGGDATPRPAVMNIGTRPTVDGTHALLEVHLFDFEGDLYDKTLRVQPRHMLRPERKFAGLDELRAQIARDAVDARQILAQMG